MYGIVKNLNGLVMRRTAAPRSSGWSTYWEVNQLLFVDDIAVLANPAKPATNLGRSVRRKLKINVEKRDTSNLERN